jgi:hypothetical protein
LKIGITVYRLNDGMFRELVLGFEHVEPRLGVIRAILLHHSGASVRLQTEGLPRRFMAQDQISALQRANVIERRLTDDGLAPGVERLPNAIAAWTRHFPSPLHHI